MEESKGKVILAGRDEGVLALCTKTLQALGYGVETTNTVKQVWAQIEAVKPVFVLSELYLNDGASFVSDDLCKCGVPWILLANIVSGDSVSLFLSKTCENLTLLDYPLSVASLVEAVDSIESGLGHDGQRKRAWLYEWDNLNILRSRHQVSRSAEELDSSSMDFSDSNTPAPSFGDYRVPTMTHVIKPKKRGKLGWFNAPILGNLRTLPFASVLWRFVSDKATGSLLIRRRTMTMSIYFKDGTILGTYCSHPIFDFFEFLRENGFINQELLAQLESVSKETGQSLNELWLERESHKRSAKNAQREFLRLQLLECFRWTEGAYFFQAGATTIHEFPLGDAALREVIEQGIFDHTPLHRILRKTDEIIPYILKLNVEPSEARRYFTRPECFEMIDNLAFGDTLVEMLVHFPSHYPIHQTVYMLLILGLLELG